MIFTNKKAISPLIATILLIAFAVSIGALIMNWTSSGETGISANAPLSCSAVKFNVLSACHEDTEMVISLQNNGPIDINSVLLRDQSDNLINYRVPSSSLSRGEGKILRIPKQNFNSSSFEVIPIIILGVDELVCTSKSISSPDIVEC